jgi:hypothetical protein
LIYHHARLEASGRHVVSTLQLEGPAAARTFFGAFKRELDAHLEAEETWVLPPFAGVRKQVYEAVCADHVEIRRAADLAEKSLDAGSTDDHPLHRLLALLEENCRREESDLYRWSETAIGEHDSRAVLQKIEAAEFGGGRER